MWYLVWFLIGAMVSLPHSSGEINSALDSVWVLMLVALFASLLVPFSAFSGREKFNRVFLVYAPLVAFGAYGMLVYREPTFVHIMLMIAAMGMHLAYWTSGIHSRGYRMEQWKVGGFPETHPACTRLIAFFNATGRSEVADELLTQVFAHMQISSSLWSELKKSPYCDEQNLREELGSILPPAK